MKKNIVFLILIFFLLSPSAYGKILTTHTHIKTNDVVVGKKTVMKAVKADKASATKKLKLSLVLPLRNQAELSASIINSPNLSIFPLLAYHKICNDHYRNEKWQPFEPWTCNIDYLRPGRDNMNAYSFIAGSTFTTLMNSIIDLENSNLPLDYFTAVLSRAQYGDETAVPVSIKDSPAELYFDPNNSEKGGAFDIPDSSPNDYLQRNDVDATATSLGYVASLGTSSATLQGFAGDLTVDASLKVSALVS